MYIYIYIWEVILYCGKPPARRQTGPKKYQYGSVCLGLFSHIEGIHGILIQALPALSRRSPGPAELFGHSPGTLPKLSRCSLGALPGVLPVLCRRSPWRSRALSPALSLALSSALSPALSTAISERSPGAASALSRRSPRRSPRHSPDTSQVPHLCATLFPTLKFSQ